MSIYDGKDVVNTAIEQLGTNYVWGGTTPSGFDCSGLVQYSFSQNGIDIPRTAQEQYKYTSDSRINNASDLQRGDLVFFKGAEGTNTTAGHVGIYMGDGKFIESPKTGDVVKVSDISNRTDFMGGGRIAGADELKHDDATAYTTGGSGINSGSGGSTSSGGTVINVASMLSSATSSAENDALNFFGRVVAFLTTVFLGVVAVVLFGKAFNIKKPNITSITNKVLETESESENIIQKVDKTITNLIEE